MVDRIGEAPFVAAHCFSRLLEAARFWYVHPVVRRTIWVIAIVQTTMLTVLRD